VKTQVILPRLGHWPARMRNAAVSPLLWLYAALPATLAVWLAEAAVPVVAGALAACVLVYHFIYQRLLQRTRQKNLAEGDITALANSQPADLCPPPARPASANR
jgi:hypothetical protein